MKRLIIITTLVFTIINLWSQQRPEIAMQKGHTSDISAITFTPDGKYFMTSSWDNSLILWDAALGKQIRTFISSRAFCVAISSDAKFAISAHVDSVLRMWDIETGELIRVFRGHTGYIWSVAISPDNKYAVSGGEDHNIIIWDISTGKEFRRIDENKGEVYALTFSPDGKYIASGSNSLIDSKGLTLWDAYWGTYVKKFDTYSSYSSVAFSPEGNYLAAGAGTMSPTGGSHSLVLFSVYSGKEYKRFEGHSSSIRSVCFSKDGKDILSGSLDNSIKYWDIQTTKELWSKVGAKTVYVYATAISPQMDYCLSGGTDGVLRKWDISQGNLIKEYTGNLSYTASFRLMPNGKNAMVGELISDWLRTWNLATGRYEKAIYWPYEYNNKRNITEYDISPDGNYIIAGSSTYTNNGTPQEFYQILECNTGKSISSFDKTYYDLSVFKGFMQCLAVSPNMKYMISGNDQGMVNFFDLESKSFITSINSHTNVVKSIAFSPDGRLFASGSKDMTAKIYDVTTQKELVILSGHTDAVEQVVFTPDGKQLLTSSWDKTLKLWDVATGKLVKTFKGHENRVFKCTFAPDGKKMLSGAGDGTIKLWDVATANELKSFSGHSAEISSISFLPNNNFAVSASYDNTIRIWNLTNGVWTAFLENLDGTQWFVFNSEGYWDSSADGGELVAMVNGLNCWNIDQFAVQNNRPDLIFKNLPYADAELVTHYHNQYLKRLRKFGLTENAVSAEYHLPEAVIKDSKVNGKFITLDFSLADTKYNLTQYNIFVNNVPVFGAYGKPVKGNSTNLSENVELISGQNKIEVSCMNEKGAESYRALLYANYDQKVRPNLYVLAFGVSKYENSDYNLQYADKDAKDLSKMLESLKGKGFDNVYTKIYTNKQVTHENIKAAKEFVSQAKVDDFFVLFIAGHGMHDSDADATYYYVTYNADINNLKNTAANFENIEDLLQGIPPRNKLFLMDACESGEIDAEDGQLIAIAENSGFTSRGFKKGATAVPAEASNKTTNEVKKAIVNQRGRYIYNDLTRRSGAIVFSSSKGGELSYERNDIKNGLFTKYVMEAFQPYVADKDYDGVVSVDELKKYVSEQVAKASNNMQHPVVDRDNIYQKFGFGIR